MSDGTGYQDWVAHHFHEFARWQARDLRGAGETGTRMPWLATAQAFPDDDRLLPDLTHLLRSPGDPGEAG